jgi:hypothetical protein
MLIIGLLLLLGIGAIASDQIQLTPENKNVAIIAAVILVAVYLYKQNVTEPFAISKDVRKYLDDHLVNNMETAGHIISHGDIQARNNIHVNGRSFFKREAHFKGGTLNNPKKQGTHFPWKNGKNYIRGSTEVNGSLKTIGITNFTGGHVNNHKKLQSHFPFKDGQNYIRGTTNLTGKLKGNSIIEAPVIQGEVLRFGKENALWEENGVPVFGKIKSSEFADNGTKIRYNMVKESKFDIKTGTFVKDDQSYFNNYNWSK